MRLSPYHLLLPILFLSVGAQAGTTCFKANNNRNYASIGGNDKYANAKATSCDATAITLSGSLVSGGKVKLMAGGTQLFSHPITDAKKHFPYLQKGGNGTWSVGEFTIRKLKSPLELAQDGAAINPGDLFALYNPSTKYLTAMGGGGGQLLFGAPEANTWQAFRLDGGPQAAPPAPTDSAGSPTNSTNGQQGAGGTGGGTGGTGGSPNIVKQDTAPLTGIGGNIGTGALPTGGTGATGSSGSSGGGSVPATGFTSAQGSSIAISTIIGGNFPRKPAATGADMPPSFQFPAFRNHLYVSTSGNDGNSGSESAPLRNIRTAIAKAKGMGPGTEIIVRAGQYNEQFALDMAGNTGGWYALRGYPGERPVIRYVPSWQVVSITGSYILFEGFELNGSKIGTTMGGVRLNTPAEVIAWGTRQSGCGASAEACGTGVYVEGKKDKPVHHVITRDIVSHDYAGGGIQTSTGDFLLVEDNVTYNNANFSFYGHSGISVFYSKAVEMGENPAHRTIVRRNISFNNFQMTDSRLIGQNYPTDGNGVIIDLNTVYAYPHRTLIENNLVFNNGGSGIHSYSSNNIDIINNTSYMNSANPKQGAGEIYGVDAKNLRIYNNVMYGRPGKRITINARNSNVDSQNNVLFGTGAVEVKGASDVFADPLFTAPSTAAGVGVFTLKSGSPAINRARSPLVAGSDLLRKPAIGTRDAGAFESQ